MTVPEPADKLFVERVQREVIDAQRRSRELLDQYKCERRGAHGLRGG